MSTREQTLLAFLDSPAVTYYTTIEREAALREAPQSDADYKEAKKVYPRDPSKWREYRTPVKYRTTEEMRELKAKLARRAARPDYLRTDPWAGIDVNPWGITEVERKRLGLGRFR